MPAITCSGRSHCRSAQAAALLRSRARASPAPSRCVWPPACADRTALARKSWVERLFCPVAFLSSHRDAPTFPKQVGKNPGRACDLRNPVHSPSFVHRIGECNPPSQGARSINLRKRSHHSTLINIWIFPAYKQNNANGCIGECARLWLVIDPRMSGKTTMIASKGKAARPWILSVAIARTLADCCRASLAAGGRIDAPARGQDYAVNAIVHAMFGDPRALLTVLGRARA